MFRAILPAMRALLSFLPACLMLTYHLDARLAQDIVARTMKLIDSNVNVMDARSGNRERIGEMHEGALPALSQARVVDIDDAVAKHLYGVG